MLISVTSFFRDPEAFEALQQAGLPAILVDQARRDDPIRIWVPGCSTGEEAYSLAIALLEFLGDSASDARSRSSPPTSDDDGHREGPRGHLPGEHRGRRLAASGCGGSSPSADGGYRISKIDPRHVRLRRQNVITDPPFSAWT